ncbi:integrator complex subunit 8 [Fopius arisanus]|uniref:INTS8 protein n=1 Tax=Fopius arisanus TaxID=64838 RepID=A0A0C9QTU2_9HYME|nr:PREDICTED: integrator complex subunit 8 [Fopius arisanus]
MMDVDLLRPGTVPISPDTILWFEFLLNPGLLEKHISKAFPDPSPTDLMIKFMSINLDQKDNEVKIIDPEQLENGTVTRKWSYKSVALKILSLKVAAYLKWDLDILEKKLPLPMQLTFLQDLFYVTGDIMVDIPSLLEFPLESINDQLLFTIVLYHRWTLRTIVNRALNSKQHKAHLVHLPGIQEPSFFYIGVPPALIDDIMRKVEMQVPYSLEVLNAVLQMKNLSPKVLTFDTFQMLTEDTTEIKQNWERMRSISPEEFKCQIHYDLATFHLLREEYSVAKYHVSLAKELFDTLTTRETRLYCRVLKENLEGYCHATNVRIPGVSQGLTQQFHASIKDQYRNIVEILEEDNTRRQIPMVYRDNLELDIQGGLINRKIVVSKELLMKIQCLNLVRKVLDGEVVHNNFLTELKSSDSKGLEVLLGSFESVLESSTPKDKKRISRYMLYLVMMSSIPDLAKRLLSSEKYRALFTPEELTEISREASEEDVELPPLLLNDDWGVSLVTYTQSPRFQMAELERQLTLSYDPNEIRGILLALDGKNPTSPPWRVSSRWELPIPLQSVVMALPRSLHQDFAYILLAKSRELVASKDFTGAKLLLTALEEDTKREKNSQIPVNPMYKLLKLISWEYILVDIWSYTNDVPPGQLTERETTKLVEDCKQCLGSLQATDQVIPRQEVIEYCTVFLLNMGEWDYLINLEKRWSHCEFSSAISIVCQDVVKFKGSKKFSREAWDMILLGFGPNRDQPLKRSSSGAAAGGSLNKDLLASISGTLARLREPTALNIVISLLARLHNVLRDEPSLELYTQYLTLWPASIPNSNSYNIRTIAEFLFQLLTQALKFYPTNVSWLRVMGDLNFVLGYYESAIKYYLEAIMVSSDLFSQQVPRPLQSVYWRMIKCCAHLQCYTQATVLCQFLEDVNYSLAFAMASSDQKSCATADAMDAYYHCIWDVTILEFLIHLHSKRGEHHRKQLAIKIIGLLELNSNNNEEIQREAANIRKTRFLRALAKQYVC